jgi:hypothetical protein
MSDTLHYFIDEAGDDTLFARGGELALGRDGVSSYFILGKLEIHDPPALRGKLEALRQSLLADSYFGGIPSFDPAGGKTALGFHAKDDLPEVRYEVLKLLRSEGDNLRFYAVVKDKVALAREVAERQASEPGYAYQKKSLYDDLVRQLFNKFHRIADTLDISFSERGSSDRTKAFEKAINHAGREFEASYGLPLPARTVRCSTPRSDAGLQAVDYFLWALQRFFERREERFLSVLCPQFGEISDLDFISPTKGRKPTFWNQQHPLTTLARFDPPKKKRPRI